MHKLSTMHKLSNGVDIYINVENETIQIDADFPEDLTLEAVDTALPKHFAKAKFIGSLVEKYAPGLRSGAQAVNPNERQYIVAASPQAALETAQKIRAGLVKDYEAVEISEKAVETPTDWAKKFKPAELNPAMITALKEFASAVKNGKIPENVDDQTLAPWIERMESAVLQAKKGMTHS